MATPADWEDELVPSLRFEARDVQGHASHPPILTGLLQDKLRLACSDRRNERDRNGPSDYRHAPSFRRSWWLTLSRHVAKGVDRHPWWIAHLHPAICDPMMGSPQFGRNLPPADTANDPSASCHRPQIAGCSGVDSADKPTISLLERRTGGRH